MITREDTTRLLVWLSKRFNKPNGFVDDGLIDAWHSMLAGLNAQDLAVGCRTNFGQFMPTADAFALACVDIEQLFNDGIVAYHERLYPPYGCEPKPFKNNAQYWAISENWQGINFDKFEKSYRKKLGFESRPIPEPRLSLPSPPRVRLTEEERAEKFEQLKKACVGAFKIGAL